MREKRQLDYYSLVDDYNDGKDFDEEELYVANEDDDAYESVDDNNNGDNYLYDELEDPNVEPLRLNEALLDIGWMSSLMDIG